MSDISDFKTFGLPPPLGELVKIDEKPPENLGYIARMWYCGDWCDCRQPRIMLRYGKRWTDYKEVENGAWIGEPEETEWAEQKRWLVSKAKEYKCINVAEIVKEFGGTPVQ